MCHRFGRFSEEEVNFIGENIEDISCKRKTIGQLAREMKRPYQSVYQKYGQLRKKHMELIK